MTILERARELGLALANSEEYNRMLAAQVNVETNEALSVLLNELRVKRSAMMELMRGGDFENTLILELSSDVERLQSQMMENPLFMQMMEAEHAFSELLSSVDREINECIGGKKGNSCSGNCSSCNGCAN